ncbi:MULTISPECIES: Spo0B domain-containing protein [unclassified Paenibacillus]|nr:MULTISPECIES: Spo0B domain-containing protein [unclassified Paenibacillus]
MRAQTHEYSNKLYIISGLIHLESYQKVVKMISRESDVHQNLIQFIMRENSKSGHWRTIPWKR